MSRFLTALIILLACINLYSQGYRQIKADSVDAIIVEYELLDTDPNSSPLIDYKIVLTKDEVIVLDTWAGSAGHTRRHVRIFPFSNSIGNYSSYSGSSFEWRVNPSLRPIKIYPDSIVDFLGQKCVVGNYYMLGHTCTTLFTRDLGVKFSTTVDCPGFALYYERLTGNIKYRYMATQIERKRLSTDWLYPKDEKDIYSGVFDDRIKGAITPAFSTPTFYNMQTATHNTWIKSDDGRRLSLKDQKNHMIVFRIFDLISEAEKADPFFDQLIRQNKDKKVKFATLVKERIKKKLTKNKFQLDHFVATNANKYLNAMNIDHSTIYAFISEEGYLMAQFDRRDKDLENLIRSALNYNSSGPGVVKKLYPSE